MKKVLVGMSGGVDSSVAALLLKKQGYEVIGATMVLFDDSTIKSGCLSIEASKEAKEICDKLEIKHYIIDLKDIFKKFVIDNFVSCYENGLTPNPCVECNKHLKFGALWQKAKELGCDYIATGHYAKRKNNMLMISSSKNKDQSYFLYGINKEVIPHILFPLENFCEKEDIRKIAEENSLVSARKKDSQEICFIPDNNYTDFIKNNCKNTLMNTGNFIDIHGNKLGIHKGIYHYTIGQRKGLGISNKYPLYVIDIDKKNNTITLGEEKYLYKNELVCTNINILVDSLPLDVEAKIRFRAEKARATLKPLDDGNIKVIFEKSQRAITKGQSVVFYKDNVVIGGGIII